MSKGRVKRCIFKIYWKLHNEGDFLMLSQLCGMAVPPFRDCCWKCLLLGHPNPNLLRLTVQPRGPPLLILAPEGGLWGSRHSFRYLGPELFRASNTNMSTLIGPRYKLATSTAGSLLKVASQMFMFMKAGLEHNSALYSCSSKQL